MNVKLNKLKMRKVKLELVKSRKAMEAQGYAKIESNELHGFDEAKYVLVLKDDYILCCERTCTYPTMTVRDAIDCYNGGIILEEEVSHG